MYAKRALASTAIMDGLNIFSFLFKNLDVIKIRVCSGEKKYSNVVVGGVL